MKKVFVRIGGSIGTPAGEMRTATFNTTSNPVRLYLSGIVWEPVELPNNSTTGFGFPEGADPVTVDLDFTDDDADIAQKIKSKMVDLFGVSKHDVVLVE
jgi:hypothetical protein